METGFSKNRYTRAQIGDSVVNMYWTVLRLIDTHAPPASTLLVKGSRALVKLNHMLETPPTAHEYARPLGTHQGGLAVTISGTWGQSAGKTPHMALKTHVSLRLHLRRHGENPQRLNV